MLKSELCGSAVIVSAVIFLTVSVAKAQVVTEMTQERIREAITWGSSQKNVDFPEIMSRSGWSWKSEKPRWSFYSTPFLRVASAAHSAKKKYKNFTEADVTPEMLAPELHIYGLAVPLGGMDIANVEAIVITKVKEKNRESAIQPVRTEPLPADYQNLFGAKTEGRSMLAVFPLSLLREGHEVHIVYDKKTRVGSLGGCDDCAVEFKPEKDKVR